MRKDIEGYEGRYQVDSEGYVVSLVGLTERVLKPYSNASQWNAAHPRVVLHKGDGSKQKTFTVHGLVARAFLPAPSEGQEILHRDGNHENCAASNLRWGTRSENTLDQVRDGVHNNARKTHCKRGHEFTVENTYPKSGGGRGCRTCRREAQTRWKERQRG